MEKKIIRRSIPSVYSSHTEYDRLKRIADRYGLSVSDFLKSVKGVPFENK